EVSNKGGGNTINMEQLLLFAPDVIVLSADGAYGKIAADKQWQALEAVKQGRYYEIPLGPYNWLSSPPSVNRIIGIKWLGSLVYPDLYNYDMVAEAQEFYKLFWHYDLSKEEAQELLANSTFKTK
ncbi:MAG: ABC transporter substrate-binding protein, partial [Clostridia bacterium]|nr:ABC transporter substrate-binding protein [Clostridia bacterium]